MAVNSISGAISSIHIANTQQTKAHHDSDGDNDAGKVEQVEQPAAQQATGSLTSGVGTHINTKA